MYFEDARDVNHKRDIVFKWKESTVTLPDMTSEYWPLCWLKLESTD